MLLLSNFSKINTILKDALELLILAHNCKEQIGGRIGERVQFDGEGGG